MQHLKDSLSPLFTPANTRRRPRSELTSNMPLTISTEPEVKEPSTSRVRDKLEDALSPNFTAKSEKRPSKIPSHFKQFITRPLIKKRMKRSERTPATNIPSSSTDDEAINSYSARRSMIAKEARNRKLRLHKPKTESEKMAKIFATGRSKPFGTPVIKKPPIDQPEQPPKPVLFGSPPLLSSPTNVLPLMGKLKRPQTLSLATTTSDIMHIPETAPPSDIPMLEVFSDGIPRRKVENRRMLNAMKRRAQRQASPSALSPNSAAAAADGQLPRLLSSTTRSVPIISISRIDDAPQKRQIRSKGKQIPPHAARKPLSDTEDESDAKKEESDASAKTISPSALLKQRISEVCNPNYLRITQTFGSPKAGTRSRDEAGLSSTSFSPDFMKSKKVVKPTTTPNRRRATIRVKKAAPAPKSRRSLFTYRESARNAALVASVLTGMEDDEEPIEKKARRYFATTPPPEAIRDGLLVAQGKSIVMSSDEDDFYEDEEEDEDDNQDDDDDDDKSASEAESSASSASPLSFMPALFQRPWGNREEELTLNKRTPGALRRSIKNQTPKSVINTPADSQDSSADSSDENEDVPPRIVRRMYPGATFTSPIKNVDPEWLTQELFQEYQNFKRDCIERGECKYFNSSQLERTLIDTVTINGVDIKTSYHGWYPRRGAGSTSLYICDACFNFAFNTTDMDFHFEFCTATYPPGNEIYRQNDLSIYEVDGTRSKTFCKRLCLFATLFIGSKILVHNVEPFFFYLLYQRDESGDQKFIGYFSKEKSHEQWNLSCILVLPPYQAQGYGRFLMDFSFLLSRAEDRPGSPETPFSQNGHFSYGAYWRSAILEFFKKHVSRKAKTTTVLNICQKTGIRHDDVMVTLLRMGWIIKETDRRLSTFYIEIDWNEVDEHWDQEIKKSNRLWIDEKLLHWHSTPEGMYAKMPILKKISPVKRPPPKKGLKRRRRVIRRNNASGRPPIRRPGMAPRRVIDQDKLNARSSTTQEAPDTQLATTRDEPISAAGSSTTSIEKPSPSSSTLPRKRRGLEPKSPVQSVGSAITQGAAVVALGPGVAPRRTINQDKPTARSAQDAPDSQLPAVPKEPNSATGASTARLDSPTSSSAVPRRNSEGWRPKSPLRRAGSAITQDTAVVTTAEDKSNQIAVETSSTPANSTVSSEIAPRRIHESRSENPAQPTVQPSIPPNSSSSIPPRRHHNDWPKPHPDREAAPVLQKCSTNVTSPEVTTSETTFSTTAENPSNQSAAAAQSSSISSDAVSKKTSTNWMPLYRLRRVEPDESANQLNTESASQQGSSKAQGAAASGTQISQPSTAPEPSGIPLANSPVSPVQRRLHTGVSPHYTFHRTESEEPSHQSTVDTPSTYMPNPSDAVPGRLREARSPRYPFRKTEPATDKGPDAAGAKNSLTQSSAAREGQNDQSVGAPRPSRVPFMDPSAASSNFGAGPDTSKFTRGGKPSSSTKPARQRLLRKRQAKRPASPTSSQTDSSDPHLRKKISNDRVRKRARMPVLERENITPAKTHESASPDSSAPSIAPALNPLLFGFLMQQKQADSDKTPAKKLEKQDSRRSLRQAEKAADNQPGKSAEEPAGSQRKRSSERPSTKQLEELAQNPIEDQPGPSSGIQPHMLTRKQSERLLEQQVPSLLESQSVRAVAPQVSYQRALSPPVLLPMSPPRLPSRSRRPSMFDLQGGGVRTPISNNRPEILEPTSSTEDSMLQSNEAAAMPRDARPRPPMHPRDPPTPRSPLSPGARSRPRRAEAKSSSEAQQSGESPRPSASSAPTPERRISEAVSNAVVSSSSSNSAGPSRPKRARPSITQANTNDNYDVPSSSTNATYMQGMPSIFGGGSAAASVGGDTPSNSQCGVSTTPGSGTENDRTRQKSRLCRYPFRRTPSSSPTLASSSTTSKRRTLRDLPNRIKEKSIIRKEKRMQRNRCKPDDELAKKRKRDDDDDDGYGDDEPGPSTGRVRSPPKKMKTVTIRKKEKVRHKKAGDHRNARHVREDPNNMSSSDDNAVARRIATPHRRRGRRSDASVHNFPSSGSGNRQHKNLMGVMRLHASTLHGNDSSRSCSPSRGHSPYSDTTMPMIQNQSPGYSRDSADYDNGFSDYDGDQPTSSHRLRLLDMKKQANTSVFAPADSTALSLCLDVESGPVSVASPLPPAHFTSEDTANESEASVPPPRFNSRPPSALSSGHSWNPSPQPAVHDLFPQPADTVNMGGIPDEEEADVHSVGTSNDEEPPLLRIEQSGVLEPAEGLPPVETFQMSKNNAAASTYFDDDDEAPPQLSPNFGDAKDEKMDAEDAPLLDQLDSMQTGEMLGCSIDDVDFHINSLPSTSNMQMPRTIHKLQEQLVSNKQSHTPLQFPGSSSNMIGTPGSVHQQTPEMQFLSPAGQPMPIGGVTPGSVSSVHSVSGINTSGGNSHDISGGFAQPSNPATPLRHQTPLAQPSSMGPHSTLGASPYQMQMSGQSALHGTPPMLNSQASTSGQSSAATPQQQHLPSTIHPPAKKKDKKKRQQAHTSKASSDVSSFNRFSQAAAGGFFNLSAATYNPNMFYPVAPYGTAPCFTGFESQGFQTPYFAGYPAGYNVATRPANPGPMMQLNYNYMQANIASQSGAGTSSSRSGASSSGASTSTNPPDQLQLPMWPQLPANGFAPPPHQHQAFQDSLMSGYNYPGFYQPHNMGGGTQK